MENDVMSLKESKKDFMEGFEVRKGKGEIMQLYYLKSKRSF